MPANRHQRRAAASRSRQRIGARSSPALRRAGLPKSPLHRLGYALAGLALIGGALVVLLSPHGAHTARGLFFLLILGGVLLFLAIKPL